VVRAYPPVNEEDSISMPQDFAIMIGKAALYVRLVHPYVPHMPSLFAGLKEQQRKWSRREFKTRSSIRIPVEG